MDLMSPEITGNVYERIAELEARVVKLEVENALVSIENDAALRCIDKLESERDQALWDREDGEEELDFAKESALARARLLGMVAHDLA